jgi:hypothetical protein
MPKGVLITTGQISGPTGTFANFPFSTYTNVYLTAHPRNSGTAYIISDGGSIGWPLVVGQEPLYLENIERLDTLRGWFEVAGDKICYLILPPQ